MCLSFLCASKKKRHNLTSKSTVIAPLSHIISIKSFSFDSLSSLKPDKNALGIPRPKEKFYYEISGVLVLKTENAELSQKYSHFEPDHSPIKERLKMARDRLMSI